MKFRLITLLLLFSASALFAQYHPEVRTHLDKLCNTVEEAKGISIGFIVKVSHLQDNEELSHERGRLLVKQQQHKLTIAGTEIYSNGTDQWTLLPEEKEVTIEPLEDDELTPASIFSIYKTGYLFRNLGEDEGKIMIELSPEDRKSEYVRITLYIDKINQRLDAFATQTKSGLITSINITEWKIKELEDEEVQFTESSNPDIEVIDLR